MGKFGRTKKKGNFAEQKQHRENLRKKCAQNFSFVVPVRKAGTGNSEDHNQSLKEIEKKSLSVKIKIQVIRS
jgi:hypothetical protein